MSAALGLSGLFLSAGALLLVIAPLFWVTRKQLRCLTGRIASEVEVLNTAVGDMQMVARPHGLDVNPTVEERVIRIAESRTANEPAPAD